MLNIEKYQKFADKYMQRDNARFLPQDHRLVLAFSENENIPLGSVEGTYTFAHPIYTDMRCYANYIISLPDRAKNLAWVEILIVVDLGYKRECFKFYGWITPDQELDEIFALILHYAKMPAVTTLIAREGAWG